MDRFRFWQRWLEIVAWLITGFGLLMALFISTPLFQGFHSQIDPAFWPSGAIPQAAERYQSWVLSAWGATVAGWGLLLLFVARVPFRARQPWVWPAIAWSLVLWFALDTAASLRYGVIFNAALNGLILLLAGIPLLATRGAFSQPPPDGLGDLDAG